MYLDRFYVEEATQSCIRYPEGEMNMVDEADKIMFFNANFLAFAVFVFLGIVILAIQKDLICDILKGKISPLNDAMNAENAIEGKSIYLPRCNIINEQFSSRFTI